MFSRQYLFLDQTVQKRVKNIKVLIIGSGLGSQIASLLVRTGFERITVADGDEVSVSNLNRQYFNQNDLGRNKALALKDNLLGINPGAKIKAIPRFLKGKDLQKLIPRYDYIINTIDFDASEFMDCHNLCAKHKKVEIFPMNLGFGFGIYVFKDNFFSVPAGESPKIKLISHIITNQFQSNYIKEKFEEYLSQVRAFDPQLGVGTYSNAAMVTTILVKLVATGNAKFYPDFYFLDLYSF